MRPMLERIQEAQKAQLKASKDQIGYNIAGLHFLKQEVDARTSMGVFGDVEPVEVPEKEVKRKRKTLSSR